MIDSRTLHALEKITEAIVIIGGSPKTEFTNRMKEIRETLDASQKAARDKAESEANAAKMLREHEALMVEIQKKETSVANREAKLRTERQGLKDFKEEIEKAQAAATQTIEAAEKAKKELEERDILVTRAHAKKEKALKDMEARLNERETVLDNRDKRMQEAMRNAS